MMATVVLVHEDFEESNKRLDAAVRNRVLNFIVRLQRDSRAPGLDLKHPQGAPSYVRTARVTDNYRAVLVTSGASEDRETLSLVAVKKHDDAYDLARALRLEVNAKTGAAELYDHVRLRKAIESAPDTESTSERVPFLQQAGVRALDLERFGVARDVAAALTRVIDEDAFFQIVEQLPNTQGSAVLDLAYGKNPDEVWQDYGLEDGEAIDVEDLEKALQRPISRLNFTGAAAGDEDELRTVLEGDFARWRVWLHPLQRKLATHDGWNGPYRVTGGAGTGKTVTAIHRARHLARRLDATGSHSKVLLTTYTRNLVRAIEGQLLELAGPDITKRVDVQNVDALARAVLAATDRGRELVDSSKFLPDDDSRVTALWSAASSVSAGDWDPGFLSEEWSLVILGNSIEDEAAYLRIPRSGRSRRLSRPQRAEIWNIVEQFQRLMRADRLMTFTELAARAAGALASDPVLRDRFGYRHAVIDEAQDLHPAHWKLLRGLVPADTDDLFIVGDAHQRIYGRPTPLSQFGIETRGRSRRLTINYRTSREILGWTLQVADPAVDDLDLEADTLQGARSVFRGPEPEVHGFADHTDEDAGIVEIVRRWQDEGLPASNIAIFAIDHQSVAQIAEALSKSGVVNAVVGAKTREESLGDAVRVMTMYRAKGLEYQGVVLARLGERDFPPYPVRRLTGEAREIEMKKFRSLLYVAGSRARERMATTYSGEATAILGNVHDA